MDDINEIIRRATGSTNATSESASTASVFTNTELNRFIVTLDSSDFSEEESEEPQIQLPQEAKDAMEKSLSSPVQKDEAIVDYSNVITHDETARFSSAEWFEKAKSYSITVAGQGGIGSWTSILLARLKSRLTLYDPDVVEGVNLAGQAYGLNDVGFLKVDAVKRHIQNLTGNYNVVPIGSILPESCYCPILICGFDNMLARKNAFNSWLYSTGNTLDTLFIDGRLTATELQVFCFTRSDEELINRYRDEFLFSDEEASQEVCSFKQTAYLANMIAGIITNLFVNFCANKLDSPFKRAVPFITRYNSDMMMFSTEY